MARTTDDLTIGSLSRQTGVKIETIRYYERSGLLPPPPRTAGGHRIYGQSHLRRLRFIRRGRELGFTGSGVRTLLGLVDGGFTCGEVQALTLGHLQEIRGKIDDLRRLETTLSTITEQCDGGDAPDCPIIDALYP